MLKSGTFTTPKGNYSFYEVEENGYYRLDIVTENAAFNTEPDSVLYSVIRKKSVWELGDRELYNEFMQVTEKCQSSRLKLSHTSSWKEGSYVKETVGINEKLGIQTLTTTVNGRFDSSVMICPGYTIASVVLMQVYDVKTTPMNFADYQTTKLSKDTVVAKSGEIFYDAAYLKRKYDLKHLDSMDLVVADTVELARKRLKMFMDDPFPFRGFDTETTGLDINIYGDDKLVGVILANNLTTATYFPFRHEEDFNLPMWFLKEIMDCCIKKQDVTVGHNAKFDCEVMMSEGYTYCPKYDSMQASIVDNPVMQKGVHGLKYLMGQLTKNHYLELDEIFINPKDINFAKLPKEIVQLYALTDGTSTIRVMMELLERIPKHLRYLLELECDLVPVKANQEFYGIRVDVKKYEHQYVNCNYILDILLKAFRTLTHEDRNINSTEVLSDLLYNKMHCKVLSRTASGRPSVTMAAIKKLASQKASQKSMVTEDIVDLDGKVVIKAEDLASSAYPALVILAKYREYMKLKTAFYSRFERTVKNGRIFFWVNQNGAATGRQSSPMHQLPPELKEVILSDAPDRDFWGPDYSQIELRMIAYLAGETELIKLAEDPTNDIHRIIGHLISGKEMWEITPEERTVGKRRNFGVVYLISARGLAAQLYGPGFTDEDVKFCQQQLDDFFKRFKRIDRYIKRNGALVQQRGYMETAWFRRVRPFPKVFETNLEPRVLASIIRMANNIPVQGTAADYMKLSEIKVFNYIKEKGWDKIVDGFPLVRLMLSIHDEQIISAQRDIPYEEIVKMIVQCMETPIEGAPPFFVQPARMDNWEGHSDDSLSMPIPFRDKILENYEKTGVSAFKQSIFKLNIPEEVKTQLDTSNKSVTELVKTFYSKCTLQFLKGDYVQEFTEEHVKDALKKYIQSGFREYRIDNYVKLIDDYETQILQEYMDGLIAQYGNDYKVIAEHVRHPSLTHSLIGVYRKKMPKGLSHIESIVEATRMFMEDMSRRTPKEFVATLDKVATPTDKDRFSEQLSVMVRVDDKGEVVFEDDYANEEDALDVWEDEAPDEILERVESTPIYAWELGDAIVLDCQDLKKSTVDMVIAEAFKYQRDNGFYRVRIAYAGKLLDAGFNVEELNVDDFNSKMIDWVKADAIQKEVLNV